MKIPRILRKRLIDVAVNSYKEAKDDLDKGVYDVERFRADMRKLME